MTNQRACANTQTLPNAVPVLANQGDETGHESEISIYARGYRRGQVDLLESVEKSFEDRKPDPIVSLYSDYTSAYDEFKALDQKLDAANISDVEKNALYDQAMSKINSLIVRIAKSKAQTLEGLGLQYQCLFSEFSDQAKSDLCGEFGLIFDNVKDGFERLS